MDLKGEDAEFHLKLASSTAHEQHYDGIYNVRHSARSTLSQMDVWSVALDRSKTIFNGSVEIPKHSIHSVAHQKNRNMLLSDRAEIDSLPKLEIACDEVKCSHGASVTTVHDEQLYYFQTRGVSKDEASRLIVSGFVEPVLEEVSDESLQSEMRDVFLKQVYSIIPKKELS